MPASIRHVACGPFGTFTYDPRRDRYEFDEASRRLLGELAKPEARYVDMLARMPPGVRRNYEQWRLEATESGMAGRVRVPFRLPTREIILEVQVQKHGDVVRGLLTDVTPDEQDHQALLDQMLVMNFAERVGHFGTWAYNIREDTFLASKGAVDLIMPGADPGEFTFDRAVQLTRSRDRPKLRQAYLDAVDTGQVRSVEFQLADDPDRWFSIQFMRILDDAGDAAQTCGMIQETTSLHHLVEAEAEREKLEQMHVSRARMINAAAHELNQPLTPLRLQLALLRERHPGTDLAPTFAIIERNLERLALMLQDLLDAARSQAGGLRIQLADVDVAHEVETVVTTMAPLAQKREVTIVLEAQRIVVSADSVRLQQCVSNLVHNAIKFTKQGSTVHVRVRQRDMAFIRVEDQGPGLTPEQAGRVFEPFQELNPNPEGFTGTGLGLYVTRSLMQAMGGTVKVESGPGKGCAFELQFPSKTAGHPLQA